MSKPSLKPLHCGISVAHMQESIEWYEKTLGFELIERKNFDMLNCEIAFLKTGDFEIELFRHYDTIPLPPDRREPDKDIQTQGIKHLCYEVEDITALLNDLRQKGADIVFGPREMEGTLMGFIRDNTGNLIEFMQRDL
ncbi:VOC family protein [Deltaproteobacteria bacterium]|nr:VOC family protein [Deltaproteobacteria bacterium]